MMNSLIQIKFDLDLITCNDLSRCYHKKPLCLLAAISNDSSLGVVPRLTLEEKLAQLKRRTHSKNSTNVRLPTCIAAKSLKLKTTSVIGNAICQKNEILLANIEDFSCED